MNRILTQIAKLVEKHPLPWRANVYVVSADLLDSNNRRFARVLPGDEEDLKGLVQFILNSVNMLEDL